MRALENRESLPHSAENPFEDVKPGDYFYNAVLWAREKGITSGTYGSHFSPGETCNRAQAVTFIWRAEDKPAGTGTSFGDVAPGSYYEEAVKWAVASGVTSGTGNAAFSPYDTCTRGQIVTFLYRDMGG